tara:strand:- start:170 stop:1243 length:1074 start_codon:yes stop_codon:yes gene_type:complete
MASKISSAGIVYKHGDTEKTQKTFIVLGAPRGGTSMSAGILNLCGVNTGDVIDPDNHEDQSFLSHNGDFFFLDDEIRSKDYVKDIKANIERKNENYDVWGWKDPLSIVYIERVIEKIRNPHFIIVTRDSVATAMRERVESKSDISLDFFLRKARFSNDLYMRSFEFIAKNKYPALFVSYERSLRNKNGLADLFLEFCNPDQEHFAETKRKIIEYISPDKLTGNINAKKSSSEYRYMKYEGLMSGCSSLTDVYGEAAKMVNTGEYEKALSLASLFEHIFIEGEVVSPFKVTDENLVIDLFISSRFICGIANVNLGATRKALLDLSLLFTLFKKYGSERDLQISKTIHKNAKDLMESLS